MKINQLLPVLAIFLSLPTFAQLGIKENNSVPNAKAMLDVESTNKGVLIPRMSTTARDGITSPPDGLLIYNNQTKKFNYFDNTAWQEALFGNQWAVSGSSISYSGGFVGVGTSNPQRPMSIFHSTDASLQFTNTASGPSITDGLYVGIQSTSKAFIYNFENNALGLGTNGSERITILGNGNVGIGDLAPTEKLDVTGNIKLSGKVNRDATGSFNLIPVAIASIQDNGSLLTGTSNIGTIEAVEPGHRRITINGASLSIGNNVVVGSVFSSFPAVASFLIINGKLEVKTYNLTGALQNAPFCFAIYSE